MPTQVERAPTALPNPERSGAIVMNTNSRKRIATLALVGGVGAALVGGPAVADAHHRASGVYDGRNNVEYVFAGTLAAEPGSAPASVSLNVTGGDNQALRALIGATGPQTFAVDANTSYIAWTAAARGNTALVTTPAQMHAGDKVRLRVRAPRRAPLSAIEATPAKLVADLATAQKVEGRLYVWGGRTVAIDPAGQTITVKIHWGNRRGLKSLLGNPATQTFHYDAATQFVSWKKYVPSNVAPAAVSVGTRVTLRTRAIGNVTLTDLTNAPLWRVRVREPKKSIVADGATIVAPTK